MNYAGKFDAHFSAESLGLHLQGAARIETITHHAAHPPADAIIVSDAHLLFNGDFKRSGVDLILSRDDHELLLRDYFKTDKRAPLSSPDGAHLTGDIVNALTGYTQFAQANGSASVGKVIGHVSKLSGTATAVRNGVSIILNNGDNVEKGDVVQSGSDSVLGITFIDGTVFGLSSNARMVLNEMVYDPNGSNNSSLLSLVAGTITFVAGETAKHGDMKVDTPVATMGIRGTAVLVEVDFDIPVALPAPGPPPSPSAKFQVLVEPDGTTGSYILFDKNTLTPIATVNQAGQQINISQGQVTITNAPLPPDIQKLITDVFSLKFTSNDNSPKTFDHFTDTVIPQSLQPIMLANGATAIPVIINVGTADKSTSSGSGGPLSSLDHIPGPPAAVAFSASFVERAGVTNNSASDIVSNKVNFADINAGDLPSVSVTFGSFSYQNAAHQDVTATLTAQQLADITALELQLSVVPDGNNKNTGAATWTYSIADSAFDFLGANETVTLTYIARVDNNFALNDEFTFKPFTITITGTDDAPTIAATSATLTQHSGIVDHAGGTVTFTDVDLTDRPVVSAAFTSFSFRDSHGNDVTSSLTAAQQAAIAAVEASLTLTASAANAHDGSVAWSYDVPDGNLDFLAEGETLTLTYLTSVDDGHGGTANAPITVTIFGSGNTPHLVTELAGQTGDTADHDTVSGTLAFAGAGISSVGSSLVSASWSGGSSLPNGLVNALDSSFTASGTNSVDFTFSAADNNFDFLAEGETLTIIYQVTVLDSHGVSSSRPVTFIVSGTNDTPTIAADTTAIGAATEDTNVNGFGNIATSGTIAFADVDLTDAHTASFALKSSSSSAHLPGFIDNTTNIGNFALTPVNENTADTVNTASLGWSFSLNDNDPVLQSLALGETLTQVYTVTITDNNDAAVTQDVTVTLTGTNDAPSIVSATNTTPNLTEDSVAPNLSLATSGTVTFADVDLIDTHAASFALKSSTSSAHLPGFIDNATNIGSFSLTPVNENPADTINTGSLGWSFTLNDNDPVLQSLALGETLTQVYTVTITDNNGAPVTQDVTVTLVGINDAPTIATGTTATGAVTEDTNVDVAGNIATSGVIAFADVDLIDTHTASFALKSSSSSAHLPGFTSNITNIGTFSLTSVNENPADTVNTASLGWSFTLDDNDPVLQSLALGESLTQVYTVTIIDNNGEAVTQDITVTIAGTNDSLAVVSATNTTPSLIEDSVAPSLSLAAAGTITFSDVDLINTHAASFVLKSSTSSAHLPGFTDNSSSIGSFGLTPVNEDTTDTINTGTVGWNFTLNDNDPVLQSLALGETLTQVYTVTITDIHGASTAQDVTVTLVGSNDAPSIVSATNPTPSLTEDSVAPSLSLAAAGTITFADVDLIDTHTAGFVLKSSTSSAHLPGFTDNSSSIGTFALASINENPADTVNTGTVGWSFTLNDNDPVLQSLALGETLTQVYTVTITDNNGGSTAQDVTVTLVGSNDAPTIVTGSTTPTGAVTEDTNVNGSGNIATSGTIAFADVDLIDTHTAGFVLKSSTSSAHLPGFNDNSSSIGTFSLASINENPADTVNTGSVGWSFSLNDNDPVLQSLALGETLTQVYTVTITDIHGASTAQDVTVTLVGSNDAPTIVTGSTTISGAVTEDTNVNGSGNIATSGTIAFADVDLIDTHSASFALKSSTSSAHLPGFTDNSSSIGTFSLTSVNENPADTVNTARLGWSFALNDNDAVLQSLALGETLTQVYTVTITDNNGASTAQDVTVTLVGTNDAPTIATGTTTISGAVTEDTNVNGSGNIATSGTIAFADVDLIDTHTAGFALKSSTSSAHLPGFIDNTTNIGNFALTPVNENTADTVNTASLGWSFTLNDNDPVLQSLAVGETITQVYRVTISDGHGGTVPQDVAISVSGTNDAPTIITGSTTAAGAFTHDDDGSDRVGGTIAFADVDLIDTHTATSAAPTFSVSGGTLTNTQRTILASASSFTLTKTDSTGTGAGSLAWSYHLADNGADLLAPGQRLTVLYAVTIADGHGGSALQNVEVTVTGSHDIDPAGVAGAPINLGLAQLTGVDNRNVTIAGSPLNWTMDGATHNPDGSWTALTADFSGLTITPDVNFVGATVLHVTESWTNSDGSIGSLVVSDNLEAYAPGSPIFALAGDDHLTAAAGADVFVLGQPIGNDIVYNFDTTQDRIDLVGHDGFASFADVQAHLTEDGNGNAVIALGEGQSIELQGVHASALTQNDFLFNQMPSLDNAAAITIGNGAVLPMGGMIHNTGTIALNSAGHQTDLQIVESAALQGGGNVVLSDSDLNTISGTSANISLDNQDNTISGAGQLGNGELTLVNAGTINATGVHALTIDTGANSVFNSGVLEASGSGGMVLASAVINSGVLWANGASIKVEGDVSGTGTAQIDGGGMLDFEAASTAGVVFGAGAAGTLTLGDSFHFNGAISGFAASDSIDLADIASATASLSYHENAAGTGGTLTVSDGSASVNLSLVGIYSADNFSIVADHAKGAAIMFVPHDLVV